MRSTEWDVIWNTSQTSGNNTKCKFVYLKTNQNIVKRKIKWHNFILFHIDNKKHKIRIIKLLYKITLLYKILSHLK